jgi:hypothetical protein
MAWNSIKVVFTSATFLHLLSLSLLACSYADGYLPSTEYDLINEADAILLAQPVSKRGYSVDFNVIEVLKGDFQGSEFRGSEVHTSCTDYSFSVDLELKLPPLLAQKLPKREPKYVLFLRRTKDGWAISSEPQNTMNQMIVDLDSSAFLRVVRHFIRISAKNNYEIEKRELKSLRRVAQVGRNPNEYPKELTGFIDRHLNAATPSKSFQDLVSLYAHSSKEKKREVLWAFAWGKHAEAANFFTKLLRSPIPSDYIGPISQYTTQTKNETLLVRLGKNYTELNKQERWPLMWALIRTADKQHRDLMLTALRAADKEEAGRLAEWFVRHPTIEAKEIVRGLVGNDYQENWELTFSLAGMSDVGTLDWARGFMKSSHKNRWMAYYTIAHSPLDDADILAKSVTQGNDPEILVWLIQGYGDSHNPNKWDRLRDVVNLKARDSNVDHWLRKTLEEMVDEGDKTSEALLKTLEGQAHSGL